MPYLVLLILDLVFVGSVARGSGAHLGPSELPNQVRKLFILLGKVIFVFKAFEWV